MICPECKTERKEVLEDCFFCTEDEECGICIDGKLTIVSCNCDYSNE